jgi:hypothetical protein
MMMKMGACAKAALMPPYWEPTGLYHGEEVDA